MNDGMNKICSSQQAAALVRDGAVVVCSGHMNMCLPDELCIAIEKRWLQEGHPEGLTLISGSGVGDLGGLGETSRGFEHFAHEGLVKRMIVGHNGSNHKIMKLQQENKIESYNLPYGVIEHAIRARAEGKDIYLSRVGIGTFVDPRIEGGKTNAVTTEDIVSVVTVRGTEYLAYDTPRIDVALIRGTTADEYGNLTCEEEAAVTDVRAVAMAARASGGIVLCQVKRVVPGNTLPAHEVVVPGIFVDRLIVCENPEENHRMTQAEFYDESLLGRKRYLTDSRKRLTLSPRKAIARRAAMELRANQVINLGLGVPELIADVAQEEGILEKLVLTVDPGVIGGVPVSRTGFGASRNPSSLLDSPAMFDFYDSGFDATFVGFAECDASGSVNASLFVDREGRERRPGSGGFINLTQGADCIVFCGTMTADGYRADITDGKLAVRAEGHEKKFVRRIRQITFSGPFALKAGKRVLYITERCVFRLTKNGLLLTEIAEGIDLEKDILSCMEFVPEIAEDLRIMDPAIFHDGIMGLKNKIK